MDNLSTSPAPIQTPPLSFPPIRKPIIQSQVVLGILLLGAGIIIGLLASQLNISPPSSETICRKGGYQSVRSCDRYFIAERPCCDQGADIWNKKNQLITSCGGFMPPPDAPESECEKLLKSVDVNSCQEKTCSPDDAQKIESQPTPLEQLFLTLKQWFSGSSTARTDSEARLEQTPPPSTDPTADWKTYTSEKLGFRFKYPPSFTVDDAINNQSESDKKSNIYLYSRSDTVESYLEKNDDQIDETNKTDIVIGEGINAKKITISNGANTTIYVVIPYGSNSFVEGSSLIIRGIIDGDESMFDQILSTFKFTSDPTANWKTYTSEKLGFSFKYPDSYFQYLKDFPDIGVYLAPTRGNMAGPAGLEPDDVWLDVSTGSGANLKSLDEFIALQGQGAMYINIQGKSPVLIGGVQGYKITRRFVDGNVPVANYEGIILKDELLYHLILSAHTEEVLVKNEQLFDQILSTFQFTN